jgi:hypothetical protein
MPTRSFATWYRLRLGQLPTWGQVGLWLLYGFLWIPLWYFMSRNQAGAVDQSTLSDGSSLRVPRPSRSAGREFGHVVVAREQALASALYDQLEQKLLDRIAANPRFPLTPDVIISTMRFPALPEERREALQPFVWTLQRTLGRDAGGGWQADFYEELGFSFVVIYLE